MSVEITFEPLGIGGLVAEGSYLSEAGRRMGIRIPGTCSGTPECTSCVVSIIEGHPFLSTPTEHELKMLGQEGSLKDKRLACQTIIERSGRVVIEVMPEQKQNREADMRNTFKQLPFDKKLLTLVQLEALAMSEAYDAVVDKALSFGGKFFSLFSSSGKSSGSQDQKGKASTNRQ